MLLEGVPEAPEGELGFFSTALDCEVLKWSRKKRVDTRDERPGCKEPTQFFIRFS
jgi:hypothetical protein